MTTCTRRLSFAAGHRVHGHENKCANLHGHNYVVEVTAEADPSVGYELDALGRVIDFSLLKAKIGGWIEDHWDHAFIYSQQDDAVARAIACFDKEDGVPRKVYELPMNPTAENLAKYLLHIVCPTRLNGSGVRVTHVRVIETENCWADARL